MPDSPTPVQKAVAEMFSGATWKGVSVETLRERKAAVEAAIRADEQQKPHPPLQRGVGQQVTR